MLERNLHRELPIYIQITESIRRDILSGTLPPHSKLPSEHELVRMYGVARATVRRALAKLQEEGLTYSRRAVGSFVAEPKIEQDLDRLSGFSELMVYRGITPGSHLLTAEEQRVSSVDSSLLAHLKLKLGDRVIHIRRIRLGGSEPLVIATTYMPAGLFPGFLRHDIEKRSIYEIMESEYSLKPDHATQTIEAVALEAAEARQLKVSTNSPAILIERIGYAEGVPVEYAMDYYRADRTRFRVHLGGRESRRELRVHLGQLPSK